MYDREELIMTVLKAKDDLWQIIKREFDEYEKYSEILNKKKDAILNHSNDLELLNKIVGIEEKITLVIKDLEAKRASALVEYAELSGQDINDLIFTGIFNNPKEIDFLNDFKSMVMSTIDLNEEVKLFLDYMLRFNVTIIKGIYSSLKKLTYSKDKKSESIKKQSFNLVDLRA